jgi:hypothetical protein
MVEPGLIGRPIHPRPLVAEVAGEPLVDQPVLGRDLGGRAPCNLSAYSARLKHHNPLSCALQELRGSEADNAAAHDRDVDLQIVR